MLILDADGFIYAAAPNMVPTKDKHGNRSEVQQGFTKTGAPLAKLILPESGRQNLVAELITPLLYQPAPQWAQTNNLKQDKTMATIKLVDSENGKLIKSYNFEAKTEEKITELALSFAQKLEESQFANRQTFGWVKVETSKI